MTLQEVTTGQTPNEVAIRTSSLQGFIAKTFTELDLADVSEGELEKIFLAHQKKWDTLLKIASEVMSSSAVDMDDLNLTRIFTNLLRVSGTREHFELSTHTGKHGLIRILRMIQENPGDIQRIANPKDGYQRGWNTLVDELSDLASKLREKRNPNKRVSTILDSPTQFILFPPDRAPADERIH